MTTFDRIDENMTMLLDELAAPRTPNYLEDTLSLTERTPQRPGWTFPERWLPMYAITERLTAAPRLPMRTIVVIALLILAIAAAIVVVGSQQRRLLAPYGPAGNGLVAYAQAGDIYVGDPTTRETRPLTTGPEVDDYPLFSRDGTKIAFLRSASGDPAETGHLMVVNTDGSGLRQLTDRPLTDVTGGDSSGDGRTIVITSAVDGRQSITIFDVESGESRLLDVGMRVESVSFRPPDGQELMFVGDGFDGQGIYVVRADGASDPRRIVGPTENLQAPQWSPDGSRIAYSQYVEAKGRAFAHIVNADGMGKVTLENPAEVIYQVVYGDMNSVWSPDGRSLLIGRGYWDGPAIVPPYTEPDEFRLAIVSVDGSLPDRELTPSHYSFGAGWGWSPDGTKIITHSMTSRSFIALDIESGEETTYTGWFLNSWQRVAVEP